MTIVIVAEKPVVARSVAPFARKHWPLERIVLLSAIPQGANYRFEYPRGHAWREYPLLATPRIRVAEIGPSWSPHEVDEHGRLAPWDAPANLLETADAVVCACDPDHTGAMAFALLVEQVFGPDALAVREYPALRLFALDGCSLERAFTEMIDFKVSFEAALAYGRVKRYFDWNWNANALAILGATARAAGVPAGAPPVSKYALQLLFWLGEHSGKFEEGQVVSRMARWEGTGKHASPARLGSPASYAKMLEDLIANGFVCHTAPPDGARTRLAVTERGRAFLALLHKDCRDADLPFRLEAWGAKGLEVAQPAIDRYIKTFFGKQKRFKSTLSPAA